MSELEQLLTRVAAGQLSVAQALGAIRPAEPVGDFATVDHGRADRCGFPEVVLCAGKQPDQAAAIALEILRRAPRLLLTRADPEHARAVLAAIPDAVLHERARCIAVERQPRPPRGAVAVVTAGTADLPVADEAALTAAMAGAAVERFSDLGVAGLHRLQARLPEIRSADVIVAVAGMDGALPTVLAGLVDRPVVAVPTSAGYGTGLGGTAALLTMLNGCAAGVAVVNIDNGFGAGYFAAQIARSATPSPAAPPPPNARP